MSSLTFENTALDLIEHDGRLWLRSADIARALGYTRYDAMSRVYDRHKAEFTPTMTTIFQTVSLGHGSPPSEVRLFSLRGAHLLGMFARTANGSKFRRWVLDQLDAMESQGRETRSLMAEWYSAKAELDNQNRFASLCGRGAERAQAAQAPARTQDGTYRGEDATILGASLTRLRAGFFLPLSGQDQP